MVPGKRKFKRNSIGIPGIGLAGVVRTVSEEGHFNRNSIAILGICNVWGMVLGGKCQSNFIRILGIDTLGVVPTVSEGRQFKGNSMGILGAGNSGGGTYGIEKEKFKGKCYRNIGRW